MITLDCDTVIMAIGQAPDTGFAAGTELKLERGRLTWTRLTQQTNLPAVFACGEIVTAAGLAGRGVRIGQAGGHGD